MATVYDIPPLALLYERRVPPHSQTFLLWLMTANEHAVVSIAAFFKDHITRARLHER